MDDQVKGAFLREGIIEAMLETVEVATEQLGSAAADSGPYGSLLIAALLMINNLAVGSTMVKEAFAQRSRRTASALNKAMSLPCFPSPSKELGPGDIQRWVILNDYEPVGEVSGYVTSQPCTFLN